MCFYICTFKLKKQLSLNSIMKERITFFTSLNFNPLLIGLFLLFTTFGYSQQNVSVNITGNPADPSAMLDVSSTSKGLLIPRVALNSINDITTIANPAVSLLVFNTNAAMIGGAVGFWYYNGAMWVQAIGPQGAQGATGPQGIQGAFGATGATGAAGTNGTNGAVGATGATGAAGTNGTNGAVGATGATGAAGSNGTNGAVGATGATGPVGCASANYVIKSNGTTGTCSIIYDNGTNVGIGTTVPLSKLSVGGAGNSLYTGYFSNTSGTTSSIGVYGHNNGASGAVGVYGHAVNTGYWSYGVIGNSPWSSGSNTTVGVYGISKAPSAQSSGRTWGVLGIAGDATTGYNYGAWGELQGSNDGAAIVGLCTAAGNTMTMPIPGKWAGWFEGNVSVNGQVKITGGSPGAGKVLTSDASGLASWQTPSAGGITGSCASGANYVPKMASTTSITCSQIYDNGANVGIGTTVPGALLHVQGRTANIGQNNSLTVPSGTWGANVAMGAANTISGGRGNSLYGYSNSIGASTDFSTAIGTWNAITSTSGGHAFGLYNQVAGRDAIVIGNYVSNTIDDCIQLGWNSSLADATMTLTSGGNVGIGTTAPSAQLHTTGTLRFSGAGTPAAGRVLTSDASGNATWQIPTGSSSAWALLGNAGTSPSTNFVGTTDAQELTFRTNNAERMRITLRGQLVPKNTGYSIFMGESAGQADDLANNYNVFLGHESGMANTSGMDNIAIGTRALVSNTTGYGNIAIGYWSCQNQSTGTANYNTAVGYYSLYQNKGGNNTAVGYAAGAGAGSPTYSYCTFLGYDADFDVSGTYTNAMALGYYAIVDASNHVRIGNTSVTQIGGAVSWTVISDGRVKENVKEDVKGLDFIMKLRPVTYNLNKDKQDKMLNNVDKSNYPEKYDINKIKFSGFIAQEVEQAAREVGYDFSGVNKPKTENELWGLKYSDFVVPMVKATQEQQKIIEEQQIKIDNLQKQIDELKALIKAKN